MKHPEQIVADFVKRWSVSRQDMVYGSFREYFTEDTHWDNVGICVTKGIEPAVAIMENYQRSTGTDTVIVEIVNIMSSGNTVIMERLDRMLDRDKKEFLVLPAVGVFNIDNNGKIAWWRDYFDSAYMQKSGVTLPVKT